MITDLYGCTNYSSQLWADNRRSVDGRMRAREELLATERIEVRTAGGKFFQSGHLYLIWKIAQAFSSLPRLSICYTIVAQCVTYVRYSILNHK